MMTPDIKYLIERYYQLQEHRIAMENQIRMLKENGGETAPLQDYHDRMHSIEKDIMKYLGQSIKTHPVYKWLKTVKGIGPILSAALLSTIDVSKADHASSIWKYAGLSPEQKRTKGKRLDYNPFLKITCWKIGMSFVKTKGKYRDIYESSREFYDKKFPNEVKKGKITKYTKGHKFAMSRRRVVKLFLSDLWVKMREAEGLSVSEPYAHRGQTKKANHNK